MASVGKMLRRGGLVSLSALVFAIPAAEAQQFPAPTDREHTIDLYLGAAIGSARITGMGGAAIATAEGSSGMLANPASPGVRPATSNDDWDWDWHLDSLSPALADDYDNNGIETEDLSYTPTVTYGVALQYKDWGAGLTGIVQATENDVGMGGNEGRVFTKATIHKLNLSHYMIDGQLVVGAGLRGVLLSIENEDMAGVRETLLELTGANLEAGALWKPNGRSLRVGGSLSLPVLSEDVENVDCDPLDCAGYVLPDKIKVPWKASVGVAGRRAPTPWNRKVKTRWRDEKALLWAADLVLTGKTRNGVGLEGFGQHQLQPSGRKHSLSVRSGVEYEWFPGRFRIRGGSYYEPSRFRNPEGGTISGRLHATIGFDWRIWSFGFLGDPYRLRLSATADGAHNFSNSGISIGFWH